MKKLIIPSKLNEGDTVAFISISGGRAGDEDMIPRYLLGKRRFEKIFHVKVVETPHALRGSGYLYEHPEKRVSHPVPDFIQGNTMLVERGIEQHRDVV